MGDRGLVLEMPVAVTICDARGRIAGMNGASARMYGKFGGRKLVGRSLFDCHPGQARRELRRLLRSRRVNVYTIQRRGRKRIVIQAPWYRRGRFEGYVELNAAFPAEAPHFVRGD